MSETVLSVTISAIISPVILAVIGGIGWLIKDYLKRIDNQVSNSHDTNLRDDVDEAKREATAAKEATHELQATVAQNHGELTRSIAALALRLDAHIDRKAT